MIDDETTWKVTLYGITWDDGKGEYDVSDLPVNLCVTVRAHSRDSAIEYALDDASDEFGSLIESTAQIDAEEDDACD